MHFSALYTSIAYIYIFFISLWLCLISHVIYFDIFIEFSKLYRKQEKGKILKLANVPSKCSMHIIRNLLYFSLQRCWFFNSHIASRWKRIPIYLFWCIWREMNDKSFEDQEHLMDELGIFFFITLFYWLSVVDFYDISFHDFLLSQN